jgi:enolase-phosphatase E1
VSEFLQRNRSDPGVRADIARLEAEHSAEAAHPAPPRWSDDPTAVAAYLHWLMDRDRKSTGLKSLQGKIWDEGYREGELRGEVYPDVPPALERWRRQGIVVAIFSSGSVQAQRSLFQSTAAGDLTRFIRDYFDTTTGPKTAPESYGRIAQLLQRSPAEVLFLSDIAAELDAARAAGMQTALCFRGPGLPDSPGPHPVIRTFDQVSGATFAPV